MRNCEDCDDLRAAWDSDKQALQVAITALIKISEPRVGGGRWAAAVANEALDRMTCAGDESDA